jgi:siroheme synthase
LVVSGHDEEVFASAVAALEPSGVTIVVLMGLGRRAAIARRLIDRGWPHGTPAAIVSDATRTDQQTWRGTLGELAADAIVDVVQSGGPVSEPPGTIVIGAVAGLDLTELNLADVASGFSRTMKEQRNASN